jgi:hypothetical protein
MSEVARQGSAAALDASDPRSLVTAQVEHNIIDLPDLVAILVDELFVQNISRQIHVRLLHSR